MFQIKIINEKSLNQVNYQIWEENPLVIKWINFFALESIYEKNIIFFKCFAIINSFCALLPIFFVLLVIFFAQISEKISLFFYKLSFFTMLFIPYVYLISLIMIFVTLLVELFKKNKSKKDYLLVIFGFIYIALASLLALFVLLFYRMI